MKTLSIIHWKTFKYRSSAKWQTRFIKDNTQLAQTGRRKNLLYINMEQNKKSQMIRTDNCKATTLYTFIKN